MGLDELLHLLELYFSHSLNNHIESYFVFESSFIVRNSCMEGLAPNMIQMTIKWTRHNALIIIQQCGNYHDEEYEGR